MDAGFNAYAVTVKHHSVLLERLQKRIDALEEANTEKSLTIEELVKDNSAKDARIDDLVEENSRKDDGIHDLVKANYSKDVRIDEPVAENSRRDVRFDDLEKRMNAMQEKIDGAAADTTGGYAKARARAAREQLTVAQKKELDENLYQEAENGKTTDVKILIGRGADVNGAAGFLKSTINPTALSAAAMKGHLDTVQVLIEHGADLNARSLLGGSALITATASNQSSIVAALISAGANLNLKANLGSETALDTAFEKGYSNIIKMLQAAGAKRSSGLR